MVAESSIAIALTLGRFSWKWALRPLILGPVGTALTVYEVVSFMLDARVRVATTRFFDGFHAALRGYAVGFEMRGPVVLENIRIAPPDLGVIRTVNFGHQGRAYEVGVMAVTETSGRTRGHIIVADAGRNVMLDPEDLPSALRDLFKRMATRSLLTYP